MATTERGPQMPSLSLLLPLSPRLMLIPGMDMDTAATTGLMATMATTERGPRMPSLQLMLLLTPLLMLMLGTDTTDTVDTVDTVDTATGDTAATTAHMDMVVTGAKQTNREVDSSSDCDFPSTLASISRACA